VQLDKLTLPEYLEVAPCERMGHAGRDYSQFAELRGGTLWRSDFVLRQKAAPTGDVQMEFKSALLPDQNGEGMAAHEAVIRVTGVTVGNARAMVMLPDGFEYVPGSATVDGAKVTDAEPLGAGEPTLSISENVVITVRSLASRPICSRPAQRSGRRSAVRARTHVFDSQVRPAHPAIESQLNRGTAIFASRTITPRFDVLKTELAGR
jgi:hypothetical protein